MELGLFIRKSCNKKNTCKYCCISLLLSILSCAFSIIVLCKCFPRIIDIQDKTGFDYIGFIIGVLSLLITFVLGWNIFTALDLKKDWKYLERKTIREISQLKEERKLLKEYVDTTRNYTIGITNLIDGKYGTAVAFLCSAAVKANKIKEKDIVENSLSNINNVINKHKDNMGNISYLDSFMQLIKDDFNKIEDKRIKHISKAIEEIISENAKKAQK